MAHLCPQFFFFFLSFFSGLDSLRVCLQAEQTKLPLNAPWSGQQQTIRPRTKRLCLLEVIPPITGWRASPVLSAMQEPIPDFCKFTQKWKNPYSLAYSKSDHLYRWSIANSITMSLMLFCIQFY